MKCPTCNAEMENGYIQAGHMILWTPRKHKLSLRPRDDGKDIVLGKNYLTMPSIESFCCRGCEFIIIPSPTEEGGLNG
jgi:hypothetical protein